MTIPFTKAHGAKNDFLLTWRKEAPESDLARIAREICDRHTGVGADGWLVVERGDSEVNGSIQLYNSDGSEAEISGNGTRCAAAFLVEAGFATSEVRIRTGAGVKHLSVLDRNGHYFMLRMNMGKPAYNNLAVPERLELSAGSRDGFVLDVGNPQCAVFVGDFDFDWRRTGREIEIHPRFPNRTNVSFIRVLDPHTIEVRFWERGAGETMSSGTGSTGAAFAAAQFAGARSPVTVRTPAGDLDLVEQQGDWFLAGPAEIVAKGEFYKRM